ncbi:glycosyltransferase [Vreelandella titanicae]|uniref:glycosyltransferase n=1 Tax=Vreelandella titanicae TaxID=664683 RepID=UPI00034AC27B|nr:glycosyltransferase [Halomonas titanicae]
MTIRYSILFSAQTQGFHMSASQKDYLSYKNNLFSASRMGMREYFFENYLLSSLEKVNSSNASDVDFHVLVMCSTELPKPNKEFLVKMQEKYSEWLNVSYMKPEEVNYGKAMSSFLKCAYKESPVLCATARLDDDDVLFDDYVNVISDYLTVDNDKKVISFSSGFNLYVESDGFNVIGASEYEFSKIAIGLAYIKYYNDIDEVVEDNIYKCGNHVKIDKNYEVIDYNDKRSFVRINTELSDRMYRLDENERNNRLKIEYRKQKEKRVGLGRVRKNFDNLPI